jgi:hypothetical protein
MPVITSKPSVAQAAPKRERRAVTRDPLGIVFSPCNKTSVTV